MPETADGEDDLTDITVDELLSFEPAAELVENEQASPVDTVSNDSQPAVEPSPVPAPEPQTQSSDAPKGTNATLVAPDKGFFEEPTRAVDIPKEKQGFFSRMFKNN